MFNGSDYDSRRSPVWPGSGEVSAKEPPQPFANSVPGSCSFMEEIEAKT